MIHLNPSDPSCIYSTLYFIATEAQNCGITPVLTFDQPLSWKAQLIIENEPVSSILKSIVLMLGGFHMQMSFLGAIGHLMIGTGLQECLETVYAPNSVIQMLSGKSVQRAVRGHFLVDTALNSIIITKTAENILPETNWSSMVTEAANLYDELISFNITSEDLHSNTLLSSIGEKFSKIQSKLKIGSRTAKLWIQYMDMVDLLRDHIRSERTGNFKLFLSVCQRILPYYSAAGHNLYTKSVYIFLQQMKDLEISHPDVYFLSGHHVIRRSDRFWAGRSCDLVVEQDLMRLAKSRAGFTRGGGSSEDQRLVWIQSMPASADVNTAMQQITNLYYETSDQHKDCSESR